MKKITVFALAVCAVLIAGQAIADDRSDQIDWNEVPGTMGSNKVSEDFVGSPDVLNTILSNDYTAFSPRQLMIDQADTPTGRAQRLAVIGTPENIQTASIVETTTVVDTTASSQSAPYYSENPNTSAAAGAGAATGAAVASSDESKSSKSVQALPAGSKASIASQALIMESSLHSALDQVRGAKSTLKLSRDQEAGQVPMTNYQTFVKEIRDDFDRADQHRMKLQANIKKYPEMAQNEDFMALNPVFRDVKRQVSSWSSKAGSSRYWSNQDQAMSDLNQLEKQLNNALDKTKSFSSDQFDTSVG